MGVLRLNKYPLPNINRALSQAFWNGFGQGLSGADHTELDWSELEKPYPDIKPLMPLTQDATEATRLIWASVGDHIRKALSLKECK